MQTFRKEPFVRWTAVIVRQENGAAIRRSDENRGNEEEGGREGEKEISSLSGSCQVDPEGRPDGDRVSGFPMCVLGNGGLKIAHPRLFLVSVPEWRLMFTVHAQGIYEPGIRASSTYSWRRRIKSGTDPRFFSKKSCSLFLLKDYKLRETSKFFDTHRRIVTKQNVVQAKIRFLTKIYLLILENPLLHFPFGPNLCWKYEQ